MKNEHQFELLSTPVKEALEPKLPCFCLYLFHGFPTRVYNFITFFFRRKQRGPPRALHPVRRLQREVEAHRQQGKNRTRDFPINNGFFLKKIAKHMYGGTNALPRNFAGGECRLRRGLEKEKILRGNQLTRILHFTK